MRGLPRKYAKMGFAKGWREYRKDHPYKKKLYTVQAYQKTNKGRTTKRKVLGVKRMTKRRRRRYTPKRYRRKSKGIPILPLLGLVPPTVNLVGWVKDPLMQGNFEGALYNGAYSLMKDFTGYDLNQKKWTGGNMLSTYTAIFAGFAGHLIANKLGVNRYVKKLPLIGKYIQL